MEPDLSIVLCAMLTALVCTLVLETGMAWGLGVRGQKDLGIVLLANLLTNPVVSVLPTAAAFYLGYKAFGLVTAAAEAGAVLTEGLVYGKLLSFRRIHPMLLSFILNISSYAAGMLYSAFAG